MAIILPNTRNALGVPNRYSDLAAAGLRYTPPPVYRYDAYDVQGDEATLYEEDIDLADYQYNADSYDAAVIPAGYAAVCGGDARWLIGADTKLYYKNDVGTIYLPEGSPSGVTRVAYVDNNACLAIVGGALHIYAMSAEEYISQQVIDNTRVWTEISFVDFYNDSRCFAIGIADGKLAAVSPVLNEISVSILSHTTGWKIAGGIKGEDLVYYGGDRLTSTVIDQHGYLHLVYAETQYTPDSIIPRYYGVLALGDGWQSVSGYMQTVSAPDPDPYSPLYVATSASRMYGIQNGELNSLAHVLTAAFSYPYKTKITEYTDWWRVTFVAPDEAVAIRRIAI